MRLVAIMRFLHPAALIRQDALFNPNHPLKISPPNPYSPSPLLVYSCNDSNPEVTAMSTRLFPLSPLAITTLLLTLSGCATSSTAVSSPTPSGTYTNWLIEGNSTLISPPVGQYMSGALQINGTQVTGTFSSHFACTPPTGTYTGADSFKFAVNDGVQDSASATVSITVDRKSVV